MTNEYAAFAQRIQERYPEGLTGVFAIGATRRTYILEQRRTEPNPGQIKDFAAMGNYLIDRYFALCTDFFELGGQNMIVTALSYLAFFRRGPEYAEGVTYETLRLISDYSIDFYRSHNIDPYFIGLEPLFHQPSDNLFHQMAQQLTTFMHEWPYQEGRRKLVWEIASIPLFSFWQFVIDLSEAERQRIQEQITDTQDLSALHALVYELYAQKVYGTYIPMPHFYLGTNMSGDLKWRSPMPLALNGGEHIRAYYTPYPSLFLTREAFKHILEDLAFGKRLHAPASYDYADVYTPELVDAEYRRIQDLVANPEVIVGLTRKVNR